MNQVMNIPILARPTRAGAAEGCSFRRLSLPTASRLPAALPALVCRGTLRVTTSLGARADAQVSPPSPPWPSRRPSGSALRSYTTSRVTTPPISAAAAAGAAASAVTTPPEHATPSAKPPRPIPPLFPVLPPRYARRAADNHDATSSSSPPELRVDHVVIGAGVVGLAVARELARRWPDKTTYLVERRRRWGEETSSRNSEVIHAGLYYPRDSFKTAMCLLGREMLYTFCQRHGVPHRQVQKLVVGPTTSRGYLEKTLEHCRSLEPAQLRPPLRLLDGDEARRLEPDLGDNIGAALLSERTGIVSSHELMEALENQVLQSPSAEVVYDTSVVCVEPWPQERRAGGDGARRSSASKRGGDESNEGFVVHTLTGQGGESVAADATAAEVPDTILAKVVVNTSGLGGSAVLNSMLRDGHFGSAAPPPSQWAETLGGGAGGHTHEKAPLGMWYCKGNYASYKGKGVASVRRLLYPLPDMGGGTSHQGLGTHLTLDLAGNIRFGPDTEWLRPPADASHDFWASNLAPLADVPASTWREAEGEQEATPAGEDGSNSEQRRLSRMLESIRAYLPHVTLEGLSADYAGIRPKLVPRGGGFADFALLWHRSARLNEQRIWQPLSLKDAEVTRDVALRVSGRSGRDDDERSSSSSTSSSSHVEASRSVGIGGGGGSGGGGGGAMLTMAGIESPGLTSSLALASFAADVVGERVWRDRLGVANDEAAEVLEAAAAAAAVQLGSKGGPRRVDLDDARRSAPAVRGAATGTGEAVVEEGDAQSARPPESRLGERSGNGGSGRVAPGGADDDVEIEVGQDTLAEWQAYALDDGDDERSTRPSRGKQGRTTTSDAVEDRGRGRSRGRRGRRFDESEHRLDLWA